MRESRTKIAANFSLYKAHTTALPAIGKKGSPPADLDTLCDAAIANIQAFQPEPASASMLPGEASAWSLQLMLSYNPKVSYVMLVTKRAAFLPEWAGCVTPSERAARQRRPWEG